MIKNTFGKVTILLIVFLSLVISSQTNAQEDPIAAAQGELEVIQKSIDFIARIVKPESDDDALIGARTKLIELQPRTVAAVEPIDKLLIGINSRLEILGAAPAEGTTESQEIIDERAAISAQKQSLLLLTAKRDAIVESIATLRARIIEFRRLAFQQSLTKNYPIGLTILTDAMPEIPASLSRFSTIVSSWWNLKIWAKPALSAAILAATIILWWFVGGYLRSTIGRRHHEVADNRLAIVANVFLPTLISVITLALSLGALYFLLSYFELFTISIATIARTFLVSVVGVFFVYKLATNVLSPQQERTRLINVDDRSAQWLRNLIVVLAVIFALDFMLQAIWPIVSAPLAITVLNSLLAALLIALVILILAFVKNRGSYLAWWVRWSLFLTSAVIVMTAMLGYLGLSRFIAQQLVVTGAILVTMYLALVVAREISQEGAFATVRLGKRLSGFGRFSDVRINQLGAVFSVLIYVTTLLIGIPAILMQWGTRFEDIRSGLFELINGFQVGDLFISPLNLLVGVCIFVIGIVVTRLVQRWLSSAVLRHMQTDAGVKNSIRTGVGYIGIGLAAILAVTGMGVNFASLAIVAGALSLGIGFGLQNIVSNFVSGLILLIERPIKVGDFIEAGGQLGTVKTISVRATELETPQKMSVIVPNSELINGSVGNWTHKIKFGRIDVAVGVSYSSDVHRVRDILMEIANRYPEIMKDPAPFVFFVGFGESSIDFELRVHLHDWTGFPQVRTNLLFDIVDEFRKNEIEFPFPQRDLHIKSMPESVATDITKPA